MTKELIFAPVLAHFFLVLGIYLLLFRRKLSALKRGLVDPRDTALNSKAWNDDEVLKVSNNLDNQFQAPVLFYALCFVLHGLGEVHVYSLVFAWLFFFSRCLHAYIHTGSNYLPYRTSAFSVGMFSLTALASQAVYRLWILGAA